MAKRLSVGYSGVESRPIAGGGGGGGFAKRVSSHKMGPKWCDFRRVMPRSYGGKVQEVQILTQKVHLLGAPHPPKINHGYGSGGRERLQLAISTSTIFKRGGWKMVQSTASGRAFVFVFFVVVLSFFFVFCLFLCLFVFNHLERSLNRVLKCDVMTIFQ